MNSLSNHALDFTKNTKEGYVWFICRRKGQGIQVATHFKPNYCPYCGNEVKRGATISEVRENE